MTDPSLPDDLSLLLALDVFLRERHVTRAARRLGVTQGAASQRLARLREYFGDPLLVPGRPLLLPTPRAVALGAPLASALASLRAAVRAGAPFEASTSERRFVLLGSDLLEALVLPTLWPMLERQAPGVRLDVERTDADFADRLEEGRADLAFVPDFLVPRSLRRRALPPQRFVVLLRKGHPAARGRLDLEAYLKLSHALVAPRGAPGSLVDAALEKLGRERRVVARIQHFVTAPYLVASSDVAITCPALVLAAALPHFDIVARELPLELDLDRTSVVWHERAHLDAGHRWLRDQIGALLRDEAARSGAAGRGKRKEAREVGARTPAQ
jgi:DNA-binding transcriptional LysR family regulator